MVPNRDEIQNRREMIHKELYSQVRNCILC